MARYWPSSLFGRNDTRFLKVQTYFFVFKHICCCFPNNNEVCQGALQYYNFYVIFIQALTQTHTHTNCTKKRVKLTYLEICCFNSQAMVTENGLVLITNFVLLKVTYSWQLNLQTEHRTMTKIVSKRRRSMTKQCSCELLY